MQNKKELKSTIVNDKYVIIDCQSLKKNEIGKLYKAYNKQTQQKVSIKVIDEDYIFQKKQAQRQQLNQKQQRFNKIMGQCYSQYICHLHQIITDDSLSLYIMDYVDALSLDHQLFVHKYFKQIQAIIIMQQLLEGLTVIQNHKFICKYLNPRTIRFSEGFYKIGSYQIDQMQYKQTKTLKQICKAPQIRNNEPYNQKVDIYSLGVILFLMVDRQSSSYCQKQQSLTKFLNHQQWNVSYLSTKTKKIMKKMLQPNIQQRICLSQTIEEIKQIKLNLLQQQQLFQLPQKLLVIPQTKSKILDSIILLNNQQVQVLKSYDIPLRKMQSTQINLQHSIKKQITTYHLYYDLYIQALKTQYIYNILLRKGKLIDTLHKDIQIYQTIYLINTRLYLNISNLRSQINKQFRKILSIQDKKLLYSLSQFIKPLIKNIIQSFNQISKKLTKKQDQNLQIVKRRFKIIKNIFTQSKTYKQNQRFITGNQGIDYTKLQQIKFTKTKLLKEKLYLKIYNTKQQYMTVSNYTHINTLTSTQITGITFQQYVKKALVLNQH